MPSVNAMKQLGDLARVLARAEKRRVRSTHVSARDIERVMRRLVERFGTPRLPSGNVRVGVAPRSEKVAALFFDYVWSPPVSEIGVGVPDEFSAYGATLTEIWLSAIADFGLNSTRTELLALSADVRKTAFANVIIDIRDPIRMIAETLSAEAGVTAVPIFSTTESRSEQYRPGRVEVLLTSLAHVDLVDDDRLTWEQVREIRHDSESRRNLRRLFYWLDRDMIDKSSEQIAEAIDERLQKYQMALRKHGVKTATGVLECLVDPKFITSVTVVATGGSLFGNVLAGVVGAAALTIGRIACSVATNYVDLLATRGDNADIAFVHQLSSLVRPGATSAG